MPELPEVEILVRHLRPLLIGKRIRSTWVQRPKVLAPTSLKEFDLALTGARFVDMSRRGKYLLFSLRRRKHTEALTLVGHLGMTGRMYLLPKNGALPKHAAVVLDLGREKFVFEDTRYFGRLTLDARSIERLGPEPLSEEFTAERFARAMEQSTQAVKVKLLDQTVVAGVGNIYASEALVRAGISPKLSARRLGLRRVEKLRDAIRSVLMEAIAWGSTVPLNHSGNGERDGLFYFGKAPATTNLYEERLAVYDRANLPCRTCGARIRRIVQAARSTFYCPSCQR